LSLAEGSQVEIDIEAGRLVIEGANRGPLTMAELLAGFARDNNPGEVDWGPAAGRETW
jgi:antitoxin component of MazEF toxin-antitoxin module